MSVNSTLLAYLGQCDLVCPLSFLNSTVCFTADQVRRQLMRLPSNKAHGPDGVSPRVIKASTPQLCGVLHHVFDMNLSLQRVPMLWKTSCLVPVTKTLRRASKDYRLVALTSHITKTMERLILEQHRHRVKLFMDPPPVCLSAPTCRTICN